MPAPTLEGRLLCASGAAYAITGDAKTLAPDPTDVYINGAGFLQPPAVFSAGPLSIDGCLVGEIPDGLVLAFRGTMPFNINDPPTVRDWVGDFQADPIAVNGFPGAVHAGFSGALAVLAPSITAELQKQQANAQPGRPLFITGHSKGARWRHWPRGASTRTPSSPSRSSPSRRPSREIPRSGPPTRRPGSTTSATSTTSISSRISRCPTADSSTCCRGSRCRSPALGDFISNLRRFDYQPVGTLQYIESNGQIVDDSTALRTSRDQTLVREILELQLQQIALNHSIGCGSGYMSAIAPTGVCAST